MIFLILDFLLLQKRPRVYHTKYLPDNGPVLGPEPQPDAPNRPAAAAADGPRHTLERGDSVTSQVNIEMEDAQEDTDGTRGPSDEGSSSGSAAAAAAADTAAPRDRRRQQVQRQDGVAGSSGSTVSTAHSPQQPLVGQRSGSNASASVSLVPADSTGWDDNGSGSMRTVSLDLTANSSSVLSPCTSQGDLQGSAAAAAAADGKQGSRPAGHRHRLAVASQTVADDSRQQQGQQQGQEVIACSRGRDEQQQQQQQQSVVGQPAAAVRAGSFNMASAFAAMDAQLAAAVRAGAVNNTNSNSRRRSSSSNGSSASAKAVQPLAASCWHKGGHVSGFLVPEAAPAATAGSGSEVGAQATPGLRRSTAGGFVSPFAAAIHLANSVASDEV